MVVVAVVVALFASRHFVSLQFSFSSSSSSFFSKTFISERITTLDEIYFHRSM